MWYRLTGMEHWKPKTRRGIVILASGLVAGISILALLPSHSVHGEGSTMSLDGYVIVFNEDFDSLDVSPHGPGTKWIAHTPWNGDFGDAQFTDPAPDFPFSVKDGVLRIEARKDTQGKWHSGLLASMDAKGNGFGSQYGYFEMRAKMPPGPGLWPAFWLDSMVAKEFDDPSIEIDVIEHYGKFPHAYESLVIVWPRSEKVKKRFERNVNIVPSGALYADFHTYGVSVEPDWTIIYFDRKEMWRTKTPPEHKHKLMVLVNLAMGSGWPIDQTPNPSYMYVDYIKVYQKR